MSYDTALAAAETTIANLRTENRAMRIRLAYHERHVEVAVGELRSAYRSGFTNGYLGNPFRQVYAREDCRSSYRRGYQDGAHGFDVAFAKAGSTR